MQNPIPNKYGFQVRWTKFNGDKSSVGATGYATEDEAIYEGDERFGPF